MQRLEFRAMGSHIMAAIDSDAPEAAEALNEVPTWFEEWEQKLSRFRENSELSKLNASGGRPVRVSPVMWEVVRLAVEAAELSGGLVTPTMLTALEAAGYDRTFEALSTGRSPQKEGSLPAPVGGEWRAIEFDERIRQVRLPANVRLDLGGIGKGWAADQAARRLEQFGPALVDAGGDIAATGPMATGERWPIGVTDPIAPDDQVELLMLDKGGIATSGRDYRHWERGGKMQHHILDPRTGEPAQTDILSTTVVAPALPVAEIAAKAIFILGSEEGMAWLEARPALAGLMVLEDGVVMRSSRLGQYTWSG